MALTLRAVGGLSTRQIAAAYLVPEATMAQRISRAKRTVADVRFDRPGDPVVALNRAVAVGEADGPEVGLAALAAVDVGLPRHTAAAAYLHEKAGDLPAAARLYAEAARSAPNLAERHHLTRQAARLRTSEPQR